MRGFTKQYSIFTTLFLKARWHLLTLIDTIKIVLYDEHMKEINPDAVYTTKEVQGFLKVSERTMKRWLKSGILRANKVGGRYRIMGKEIIRLVSPDAEEVATGWYLRIKNKAKNKIKNW